MSQILGKGKYSSPLLMRPHPEDPKTGMALQCRILVRGMGATEGYMERLIPINGSSSLFARDETGLLAQGMVDAAQSARFKVLKPSLKIFLQGRKSKEPGNDVTEVKHWIPLFTDALDKDIDEAFFPALWDMLHRMDEGEELECVLNHWNEVLRDLASRHCEIGMQSLPGKGLKAEAETRRRFDVLCHNHLPVTRHETPGQSLDAPHEGGRMNELHRPPTSPPDSPGGQYAVLQRGMPATGLENAPAALALAVEALSSGDQAQLRRMTTHTMPPPVFYRLILQHVPDTWNGPETEQG